jgi:hypothetical protein
MAMVYHHVKYKEIHGIDEIVVMTAGEHIKLHRRLRKEGKCNVPVQVLGKLSREASAKTFTRIYREGHREEYNSYMRDYMRIRYNKNRIFAIRPDIVAVVI